MALSRARLGLYVAGRAALFEGVPELAAAILQHGEHLRTTNRLQVLEYERALAEIRASLQATLVDAPMRRATQAGVAKRLADAVAAREMNAASAARIIESDFVALRKT